MIRHLHELALAGLFTAAPVVVCAQSMTSDQRVALAAAVGPNLSASLHVNHATIVDGYALIMVSDKFTGGEQLYARRNGQWKKIGGGGGSAAANDLVVHYKVPRAIARDLVSTVEHAPALKLH